MTFHIKENKNSIIIGAENQPQTSACTIAKINAGITVAKRTNPYQSIFLFSSVLFDSGKYLIQKIRLSNIMGILIKNIQCQVSSANADD